MDRYPAGQLNKERLITVKICGKNEDVFYCSAPCLKYCPQIKRTTNILFQFVTKGFV